VRDLANCSRHRRLTSRPLLDDLFVQERAGELDAETGIGSVVLGVKLELRVGAGEPVGVDYDARRADNEQLAVVITASLKSRVTRHSRVRSAIRAGTSQRPSRTYLPPWSIPRALTAGATEEEITDVLLAIAPVTGLGRVVDATPGVANALGYDIEAALDDPVDH